MTSSTTKSEFYNPWSEHSREDIDLVNKLEDTEQKRRIADTLGEQQRRYVSNQVAEVVTTNLRPVRIQHTHTTIYAISNHNSRAGSNKEAHMYSESSRWQRVPETTYSGPLK